LKKQRKNINIKIEYFNLLKIILKNITTIKLLRLFLLLQNN